MTPERAPPQWNPVRRESAPPRFGFLLLACALSGPAAAMAAEGAEPIPRIERIEVRLLYETTGAISDSIAPPSSFATWNTVIGGGDAKEPAHDLLVQVHLSVAEHQANVATPLRVTVTDASGRKLASRSFPALFFNGGRVVRTLLVPDAGCAGRLTVKASLGTATKEANVPMMCGE